MKVYKYRGIESNCLERDIITFSNNKFFAPKFENLNDPFEANFNEIISETLENINKLFSYDVNDVKDNLNNLIDFKNKLGIFSLSKNAFSEQMWAYYASSNKGYCIEYEIEKLKDKNQNFDYFRQLEVKYTDDIPTLDITDLYSKSENMLIKMFGTKKNNWKHEEEIRLLFDESFLKNHHFSAITAIYFGYQASEDIKNKIYENFTDRDIEFYEIIPSKVNNRIGLKKN